MKRISITILILFSFGCSSAERNARKPSHPDSWIEPVRFEADVSTNPIIGNAKLTRVLGLFEFGDTGTVERFGNEYTGRRLKDKAKRAAAYNAIEGGNADFILVPLYRVKEKHYFLWRTAEAEVRGIRGQYAGLRQIQGFRHKIGSDKYTPAYHAPSSGYYKSKPFGDVTGRNIPDAGILGSGVSPQSSGNSSKPSPAMSNKNVRRQVFVPSYHSSN